MEKIKESSNFCVMCGAEIPEGYQVCLDCARANYYRDNWNRKKSKDDKKKSYRRSERKFMKGE